jgi:hypothetical protein
VSYGPMLILTLALIGYGFSGMHYSNIVLGEESSLLLKVKTELLLKNKVSPKSLRLRKKRLVKRNTIEINKDFKYFNFYYL